MTAGGCWPTGWPTTSSSPARSTSRASRRRRPARTTCCASWSRSRREPLMAVATPPRHCRLRVVGVVQGVGFRPYVYRLARECELAGFVLNDEQGVLVEVEGGADSVARFVERLPAEAPPLARVEGVVMEELAASREAHGFVIAPGVWGGPAAARVAPDTAPCDDCPREMGAPDDRRYRYPFVNCTNCGP